MEELFFVVPGRGHPRNHLLSISVVDRLWLLSRPDELPQLLILLLHHLNLLPEYLGLRVILDLLRVRSDQCNVVCELFVLLFEFSDLFSQFLDFVIVLLHMVQDRLEVVGVRQEGEVPSLLVLAELKVLHFFGNLTAILSRRFKEKIP